MSELPPASGPEPPTPTPPVRRTRNRAVDTVLGAIAWVVLLVVGAGSVFFSLLFGMATDSCSSESSCGEDLVWAGMLTVWVGTVVAVVVAAIGSAVCLTAKRYSFYWPIVGLLITIVCLLVGLELANAAGP
ncbi:hypothetical protein L5I01_33670 [Gordonia sp. HY442]|uniref:hypothetical protein n=1 Tax=Gordonia zhenghanii TaxID=2911516 RepID=UPI001F421155|nr:hypothetical protein [Gordonia zhenghanii]MCF8608314.1 hypothetical protein [Gordonia zhenghanii]